jgi:hypothetical protein
VNARLFGKPAFFGPPPWFWLIVCSDNLALFDELYKTILSWVVICFQWLYIGQWIFVLTGCPDDTIATIAKTRWGGSAARYAGIRGTPGDADKLGIPMMQ